MTDPDRASWLEQVRRDPYAYMIAHLWMDAWAAGYEAARRSVEQAGMHQAADHLREENAFTAAEKALVLGRERERATVLAMGELAKIPGVYKDGIALG